MPANIVPEWKRLIVTNALAYYETEAITFVKKFYNTGPRIPGVNVIKLFFLVADVAKE